MKKLLIALTAAASAFGLYADVAIGGAGFDSVDAAPLTWTAGDGFAANWSGTDGTMTLTSGDCGKTSVNRPAGFSVTDRDGYMALKTTLGSPVLQNVKASGSAQPIDDGFFYDGLVQFTAFDETPDLATNYTDAKIGIFPMLENPDSETAYLWVYANGGTNLWKTTKVIDGDWHRVTIKMIKNVTRTAGATEVGFVVFVDGSAVNCLDAKAAFEGLDLNPAALAYYEGGKLFRSLAPANNEFTGVAYDGQGKLDEVGFTDLAGAPEFALDENWKSLAWGSNIAEVYLWEQAEGALEPQKIDTFTGSPADFVATSSSTYYYTYKAASAGYMDQTELVEIETAQVTIDDPKTCAAKVNGVGYETIDDALTEIETAEEDVELVLCAPVETGFEIYSTVGVTLDLAGFDITAGAEDESALKISATVTITDTTDASGMISGGTVCVIDNAAGTLTIEGGIIDGFVSEGGSVGDELSYTTFVGGKVSVEENVTTGGVCTIPTEPGYIAKNVTGYWEVVKDTRFTVTVAEANEGSYIASIVVDGEAVAAPAAGEFLAETSVVVTYAANTGYKFTDPTLAEQTLTEKGSTTAPAVEALPIVAYIGSVPYYTLGAAIDAVDGGTITLANNYTMTADETKEFAKNATLDLNGKTLTVPTAIRNKKSATAGDNGSFGVLEDATVTFQNGTIDLAAEDTKGSGYGIAVYGTLNANCTITREGSAAGPIFDIFGATVNAQAAADLTSTGDVFRFKDEDVTSTVTVVAGAKAEATGSQPIFYNYKKGHTANITITGGQFKQTGTGAIFGGAKNYTEMIWNVTKMDATPAFNTASIENAYAKDMVIPNQKAVLGEDEWYHLADAIKVAEPQVAEGATLTGVALGDKFAAGETVAFTVTADDEKVKVIDTVTVNSETLTAGEAGAYSWTVPEKMPASIEIVVTTKAPAVGPSSEEGQISEADPSTGRVKFTPTDPTATEATINLNGFTGGVEVPGTIATIKGVPAAQLKIQLNGYEIDNKYFVGGDETGFSTELSNEAKPAFVEATEDVKPFEVGEEAAVTIKAVPGLKYALVRGATVDAITTTVVEAAVATEQTLKLEDAEKLPNAAFYKVQVSK